MYIYTSPYKISPEVIRVIFRDFYNSIMHYFIVIEFIKSDKLKTVFVFRKAIIHIRVFSAVY